MNENGKSGKAGKTAADNLYLMGFMGCGKTTIGRLLALKCGWAFCDMDAEIERREGMPVSQIFAEKGEEYFRRRETELLKELLQRKAHIIALGGGTAIQSANAQLLRRAGARVVWLDVAPEEVHRRLRRDHSRPLLERAGSEEEKKQRIEQMMEERRPFYERAATQREDVKNMSAEEIAQKLAEQELAAHNRNCNCNYRVWVMNGPNLNFLGIREPAIYGTQNYEALIQYVQQEGEKLGMEVRCLQSNHEGVLIDLLQEAYQQEIDGIVINPGALTHYSYALRDAIASVQIPTVEVHLSDIQGREEFRHISVTKEVCIDQISGHGFASYQMGLQKIAEFLQKNS